MASYGEARLGSVFIDIETYSSVDINRGTYAYAEGAELLLFSWSTDGEHVRLWDATAEPMPGELAGILRSDCVLIAHNATFERVLLRKLLPDFPIAPERWRCAMIRAYEHGLPGGLDLLCQILGIPEESSKQDGRQLILLFCKDRPKSAKIRRATRETHPLEWARFCEYAQRDVLAAAKVWHALPNWNYPNNEHELMLWQLDQKINDRGICLDLELCHAVVRAMKTERARQGAEVQDATDDYVQAATQRDKLLNFLLAEYGVNLPDLQASTLERRIEDPDLPEALKELLRLRLEASQTSQSKYRRAINATSPDGRVRGTIQHCGAQRTGRAAGRIIQPQNMPRSTWKQRDIELFIRALKVGAESLL